MTENKIIETLDYLFEKFGIAVDWTTENVMPYVQELTGKIVTYKIVANSIWVLISVIIIVACCISMKKLHTSYIQCKTKEQTNYLWKYSNWTYGGVSVDLTKTGSITSWMTVSAFAFGCFTFIFSFPSLIKWIIIPEVQLIKYVDHLINILQM